MRFDKAAGIPPEEFEGIITYMMFYTFSELLFAMVIATFFTGTTISLTTDLIYQRRTKVRKYN